MFSRLNATQKGLLLVLVPVLFQLLFIAAIEIPLARVTHDFNSMLTGKRIFFELEENEIQLSRMIWTLMVAGPRQSMEYLGKYREKILREHKWTAVNVSDPEMKEIAADGKNIIDQMEAMWGTGSGLPAGGNMIQWMSQRGGQRAFTLYQDQRALMRRILDLERRRVEQQPEEVAALRATLVMTVWGGFILGLLLSLALLAFFTKDIVRRLAVIADKAKLLAFGAPVSGRIEGSDEIARLERVISQASVRLSEARQRQAVVLDNAADVICSIDGKLKFTAVGEASSKIWGQTPDQLLGKSLLALLTDDTVSSTSAAFEKIAAGPLEGRVENIIRCGDGSLKNSVWTVLWSPEKRAYFCVVHDVTELRTVEKLKQHFLSVASHDLRSPLTSITMNVSILTESMGADLPLGVVTELERVQNSAQRLISLVNELLELDRLEAGKLSLEISSVGASDACEAAKDLLFGMARQSSVSIVGPVGDALILAEEQRLVQMVANLLSNAIKFSPAGGQVEINIVEKTPFAEIRIKDEGPGISAQECLTIFEKFTQAKSAGETKAKGTGLGLAVVKALADSHGGSVRVESELAKGSTFILSLPLSETSHLEGE